MRYILLIILFASITGCTQQKSSELQSDNKEEQYKTIIENTTVIEKLEDNLITFETSEREIKVRTTHKVYKQLHVGDVVNLKYDTLNSKLVVEKQ